MSEYPVILGQADIPRSQIRTQVNKANKSREILSQLPNGKALVVEFDNHQEAKDYRSMLYTMAIFKFGKAGCIGTRIIDNVLYIWETGAI